MEKAGREPTDLWFAYGCGTDLFGSGVASQCAEKESFGFQTFQGFVGGDGFVSLRKRYGMIAIILLFT